MIAQTPQDPKKIEEPSYAGVAKSSSPKPLVCHARPPVATSNAYIVPEYVQASTLPWATSGGIAIVSSTAEDQINAPLNSSSAYIVGAAYSPGVPASATPPDTGTPPEGV